MALGNKARFSAFLLAVGVLFLAGSSTRDNCRALQAAPPEIEGEAADSSIVMPALPLRPSTFFLDEAGYSGVEDFSRKLCDDYVWTATRGHRHDPDSQSQGRVDFYGRDERSVHRINAIVSTEKQDVDLDAIALRDFAFILDGLFGRKLRGRSYEKSERFKAEKWLEENIGVMPKPAIEFGTPAALPALEEWIRENAGQLSATGASMAVISGGITTRIGNITLALLTNDPRRSETKSRSLSIYPASSELEVWHIWVSADKRMRFVARYLDVIDDTVFVQDMRGAVSRMKKSELCDEDWAWIEANKKK